MNMKELLHEAFDHWEQNHLHKFTQRSHIYANEMLNSIEASIQHYMEKHKDSLSENN
jgi:hypothetical protein